MFPSVRVRDPNVSLLTWVIVPIGSATFGAAKEVASFQILEFSYCYRVGWDAAPPSLSIVMRRTGDGGVHASSLFGVPLC